MRYVTILMYCISWLLLLFVVTLLWNLCSLLLVILCYLLAPHQLSPSLVALKWYSLRFKCQRGAKCSANEFVQLLWRYLSHTILHLV